MDVTNITSAWDTKVDIVIGNDVWIGYEAIVGLLSRLEMDAIIGTAGQVCHQRCTALYNCWRHPCQAN